MVSWLLPFALLPKTFTSALFENFAQIAFPVFLIFLLVQLNFKPALVQDILPERRTLQIWGALIVCNLYCSVGMLWRTVIVIKRMV